MFKNLSLKFLAIVLAVIFWFFVVSLENTFFRFPDEVPIQVFNQAQDLALATKLKAVHLAVRVADPVTLRTLSAGDFEAYIDLRNVGAGTRKVTVFVTSKNPQVSVVKIEPSEVEVVLEPLREKTVTLKVEQIGQPFKGYKIDSVVLSRDQIKVAAAESVLKKIGQVKAEVRLDGTEDSKVSKPVVVKVYDTLGVLLEGVVVKDSDSIEAIVSVSASETQRELGVRPRFLGSVTNGVVKSVSTDPAVVTVSGSRELLDSLSSLETEMIDLNSATNSFEKTIKLILPPGVQLARGQKNEVRVKVEIEKQ